MHSLRRGFSRQGTASPGKINPTHCSPKLGGASLRKQRVLASKAESTSHKSDEDASSSSRHEGSGHAITRHQSRSHESRRDVLLSLSAAAVVLPGVVPCPPAAHANPTLAEVTPVVAPAATLSSREQAIIDVFERSTLSVVNIFDATIPPGRVSTSPESDVPEGNGTGFIWSRDGDVVTNYHVLGAALKAAGPGGIGKKVARVTLLGEDGFQTTYSATLVGADRARDLAVVRIGDANKAMLRPLPLGSSSALKVGQQVLAIGNPFGFDHTLTTGVVSGLNREIRSMAGSSIPGGIQTDAAINPGNSGGPLLDSAGNVVGLNTAIFTNTGISAGIGFAIPVDLVKQVVPQLISNGNVVRPSLNVQVASDTIAQRLKITRGALLQGVQGDGAGAKAGLLPTRRGLSGIIAGDVILAVNDVQVLNGSGLMNALDSFKVGDTVQLKLQRSGDQGVQELTLKAVLAEEK